MVCECTDNKGLDNKNINNNNLSLETMQNMSIDEIVKLYQNGHRLSDLSTEHTKLSTEYDNINILQKAYPNIEDVSIYRNNSEGLTHMILLWKNSGSPGYMFVKAVRAGFNYFAHAECVPIVIGLAKLWDMSTNLLPDYIEYITGYGCFPPVDPCPGLICTNQISTGNFPQTGIYVMAMDTVPPAIPNLTVTPGDGQIIITWQYASSYIFAYYIKIRTGSTIIEDGYRSNSLPPSYTKGDLINGTQYTVEIKAYNYSMIAGPTATATATPTIPPPVLTSIEITPTSASINVGGTQQMMAICKDQYGAIIACPTISWSSDNSAIANVNPSTGLVTGVAAGGPVNITASGGGKTSNASAITVIAPANITATAITATPRTTPCLEGTCIIDISVTWQNTGGIAGSFVPNISIDGIPVSPAPYPSESVGTGLAITHTFTVSGLTKIGSSHSICPVPN